VRSVLFESHREGLCDFAHVVGVAVVVRGVHAGGDEESAKVG
jgi:hypothetical protein